MYKRPRLKEAITTMKLWEAQGITEAQQTMNLYDEILAQQGEFLAGRFIIDVVAQTEQDLQGVINA